MNKIQYNKLDWPVRTLNDRYKKELTVRNIVNENNNIIYELVDTVNDLIDSIAGTIQTTHSELAELVASSSLITGASYLITDYRTVHTIPFSTSINTGPIEPLLVKASSRNTLSPIALSSLFPEDIIYYNLHNDHSVVPGCTRGYIYRRIDTKLNNDIGFDYRNVKFRRWKVSGNPQWSQFTVYSKYAVVRGSNGPSPELKELYVSLKNNNISSLWDNSSWARLPFYDGDYCCWDGNNDRWYLINNDNISLYISGDYLDVTMFAAPGNWDGIRNNKIFVGANDIIFVHNTVFYGDIVSRNIVESVFYWNTSYGNFTDNIIKGFFFENALGDGFANNNINGDFYGNLVGTDFRENSTGNNFTNNVLSSSITRNKIGNLFSGNIIGGHSIDNIIGNNVHSNIISGNFIGNNIDDEFAGNTIGHNFYHNVIGDNFYNNVIGGNFNQNIIGSSAGQNNIGDGAYFNNIGNSFTGNTISDSFNSNMIGNQFVENNIGSEFNKNIILDDFHSNTTGAFFANNSISNGFNNNHIGNSFLNNIVNGDEFRFMTIGNNFRYNNIISFVSNLVLSGSTRVYTSYNKTIGRNSNNALYTSFVNHTTQTFQIESGIT